jgi:tripartite ATP-independent transporter DctM subunit
VLFASYTYIHSRIVGVPIQKRVRWKERGKAVLDALPALGFPFLILGSIYTGVASPNEAAGLSLLYAIILEMFVYRSIKLKTIYDVALETGVVTAVIFILIAAGMAFSWLITFAQIPDQVLPALFGENPSPIHALYSITAIFFVSCLFIDSVVVIMVITPIIFPLAMRLGIDPIVLGTIVITQATLGGITPPLGCNIFTAIAIFRRPYLEVIRSTPMFVLLTLVMAAMLIHFPEISLFLTRLMLD